jgi:hypothetical protein
MCTVLLPPGVNLIAVNEYININNINISNTCLLVSQHIYCLTWDRLFTREYIYFFCFLVQGFIKLKTLIFSLFVRFHCTLPRSITLSPIAQFQTLPSTCPSGMFTRYTDPVAMTTFYHFFSVYLLCCHISRLHTVCGGMIGGWLITGTCLPTLPPFLMMCGEVIITVTNWNKQFLLLCLVFESLLMFLASVRTYLLK